MEVKINRRSSPVTVLIDDADEPIFNQYVWMLKRSGYVSGYRKGDVLQKSVLLHRAILGIQHIKGVIQVDHINFNKLDNRRSNLRICTNSQNHMNFKRKNELTGYYGIAISKREMSRGRILIRYYAKVRVGSKRYYVGTFKTAIEAAIARDKFVIEHHGDFATLNFPDKKYPAI